ncbi:hypothetical protein A2U01_0068252, partial [Trifolium medium]|nr:hypothetical protein [Trifolium medium]
EKDSGSTSYTLANMRMLKEVVKTPNQPLLVKKTPAPRPEEPHMVFADEPR